MTAAVLSAVYLGLLCAISPCPLATNIAAVSFVCRKSGNDKAVLAAGVLYILGRTATFCILGWVLTKALDTAPVISHALQKYMDMFLGPLLILTAMFLLGLLRLPVWNSTDPGAFRKHLEKCGVSSAVLLGSVFALSFCPTSAVLYFGTLLPLAVKTASPLLLSGIFGFSSGLPVLVFAFVIAFCSRKLAEIFDFTGSLERWTTRATGVIFLLTGVYFTIVQLMC